MGAGTSASKKYAVHADVEGVKKQSEKKVATEGRSAGAAEEDVWATVVADLAHIAADASQRYLSDAPRYGVLRSDRAAVRSIGAVAEHQHARADQR